MWFIGITAALIGLPLLSLIGSPVLWGLLPFLLAAIAAIWWALIHSIYDAEILEDLTLTRHGPRGRRRTGRQTRNGCASSGTQPVAPCRNI